MENKKMITLKQDNGGLNYGIYAGKKLTVSIPENEVEYLIKKITGWRTPTKKYKNVTDRLKSQSSSFYDIVILKMYAMGYR